VNVMKSSNFIIKLPLSDDGAKILKRKRNWFSKIISPLKEYVHLLRPLKLSPGFTFYLAFFALRSLLKPFYPCSVSRYTVAARLTSPPLLHRGVSRSSH